MSDVQLYLIEYDKDKKEATKIANGTALSAYLDNQKSSMRCANENMLIHKPELQSKELKLLDLEPAEREKIHSFHSPEHSDLLTRTSVLKGGHVSKSRADLLARTSVSKTHN